MRVELKKFRLLCTKNGRNYKKVRESFRLYDHEKNKWDDDKKVNDHIEHAMMCDREMIMDCILISR